MKSFRSGRSPAEKGLPLPKLLVPGSHFGTPVLNRFVKFIESFHQKVYCVEVLGAGFPTSVRTTATVEQHSTGSGKPFYRKHTMAMHPCPAVLRLEERA
jgi:hypothetical protein